MILFLEDEKAPDVQIFQGPRLLPIRSLKTIEQESSSRDEEKQ